MSQFDRRVMRASLVKMARTEMLHARADGRLPRRIPLWDAIQEVKRAFKERRKVARRMLEAEIQIAREKAAREVYDAPAVDAEYDGAAA